MKIFPYWKVLIAAKKRSDEVTILLPLFSLPSFVHAFGIITSSQLRKDDGFHEQYVYNWLITNNSRQRRCIRGFRKGDKAEVWNDGWEFSKWWSLEALTVQKRFHLLVLGFLQAPVVLSRDHHDVSGTDSPYRETSNVYDGSAFCAGQQRSWILSIQANKEIALKEKLGRLCNI